MKLKSSCSAWTLTETCVVLALIGLIVGVGLCIRYREKVQMPEAYRAWVKLTGNTNQLNYKEWRALLRANERQDDTTIIFIPMN